MLFALASIAVFVLIPASAQGATIYGHVGQFGGLGTGSGEFNNEPMPQRLAVHEQSGKIFVADRGNHRIQVFTPTATAASLDFSFGDSATTNEPIGVAVDQDTGDVYVTAAGTTNAIVKFNPDDSSDPTGYTEDATFTSPAHGTGTGEIGAFGTAPVFNNDGSSAGGIAVDPRNGEILVADPGKDLIQRFDSDGAYLDDFDGCSGGAFCPDRQPFTDVWDLAVDSAGDIIVADVDGGQARVDRFNGAGEIQATLSEANDPVPNSQLQTNNSGIVVGVNPATDEVLVSSVTGDFFVQETSRIYQFENDEHVDDFAAPDNFDGALFGFAADGAQPIRLYVMAGDEMGGSTVPRVQTFEEVIPPTVSIEPPSSITATKTDFSGTVNPEGTETTWHFEYRPQGSTEWTQIPEPSGNAGDGTEDVDVDATASGLEPNTDYEVRLHADGATQATTDPLPFTTQPGAPFVTTGTASFLSTNGATLTGQINPRNSETTYRFEWGTDTSYGNVVPDPDASVGDGGTPATVTEGLEDLEPGTTYHFRLVAENEFGQESQGEDASFTTLASPRGGLGAERGWEVVSQIPTGGIVVIRGGAASEDGDRVHYQTLTHGHSHPPGYDLPHAGFVAERGGGGWRTEAIDLPTTDISPHPPNIALPADLSQAATLTTVSHDPADRNGVQDIYQHRPDGGLTWITRSHLVEPGEPQTDEAGVGLIGRPRMSSLSADGRVLTFESERRLLEDHPTGRDCQYLYKWDGELRLIGVRPDGSIPTEEASSSACTRIGTNSSYTPNAVSRDGSRIVWGALRHDDEPESMSLYVHDDEGPTVEAVSEQGVDPLPSPHPLEVAYWGADREASRVFFTSSSRLTPDSGGSNTSGSGAASDLYVYDVEAGALRNLTPRQDGLEDPSVDPDASDQARVLGVASIADDGSRAYFVADGELDAEPSPLGRTPSSEGRNLYVAELQGIGEPVRTRFIAALGGPDPRAEDGNVWSESWGSRAAATSPDGKVFGFGSVESLTGEPTGGVRQLYVYDEDAASLVCASCPADGSPPADRAVNTGVGAGGIDILGTGGWNDADGNMRLVSSDGTVFFDTPTSLLPQDSNEVRDVYEYRNGELRLVSRGGPEDGKVDLFGVSRDGSTVFFRTTDALVPQDPEPGVRKVYAARVGGGFSAPTPRPPCDGDECQDPPSPSPETGDITTLVPDVDQTASERPDSCERLAAMARQRIARARNARAQFAAGHAALRARATRLARTDRRAGPRTRRLVRGVRQSRRRALQSRRAAMRSKRAALRCLRGER